jgi:hypothetical protein
MKNASKKNPTEWSDRMVQELLYHLDSNIGADGLYTKDPEKAFHEAALLIASVTPRGKSCPNARGCENKLARLAVQWGPDKRVRYNREKCKLGSAYFTNLPSHLRPRRNSRSSSPETSNPIANVKMSSVEIRPRQDESLHGPEHCQLAKNFVTSTPWIITQDPQQIESRQTSVTWDTFS